MNIKILFGACLLGCFAAAAGAAAPGIYGEIDTHQFPKPLVINRKPVIIDKAAKSSNKAKAIYLHVAPGDEWHWFAGCRKYNACAVPVYFVTESWFVNTYLPAIGSRDGREQQYRIDAARERASDRDAHDLHGED